MDAISTDRLTEMPLWRLLVLLADAEREIGPSCPTSRLIARLVNERLRGGVPSASNSANEKGVRHAG
jgi:hypothetical protein